MENQTMKQLSKRLMVTAGASTLAATGAVLGATVVGNAQTASANDVTEPTSQTDAQNQWKANSVDHVKQAVKKQSAKDLKDYQVQWGDTLSAIAEAFGTTADAAGQQLGLSDHGLLVAGQTMGKQEEIIQGLKTAGYLADGQQTQQADLGKGDQNLIMVQQGTPTLDTNNGQQTTENTTVNNQTNSQSGSQAAYEQASQAAAESQAISQSNSMAAATAATNQYSQSAASQANNDASQASLTADSESQVTPAASDATSTSDDAAATTPASDSSASNSDSDNTDDSNDDQPSARMADDDSSDNNQGSVTPTAYTPATNSDGGSQVTPASTPAATNRVNTEALINWFYNHMGKLTYDMGGSRNGSDGTADCSGSMTEALYEAGASKPAYLYSTENLHSYLTQNGYHLVAVDQPWDAQRGDVVIWGQKGASLGSAGHAQVMVDQNNAISVNYAHGEQQGAAVSVWNYANAYAYNQEANGGHLTYYVYRQ
ncbi:C40 family peptidase [Fructobacillus durionis]|uniref:Peptidoglycan hydrolase n=1 Tax=Fructobacillus durionis TaxID=283737 RepID=A0A1I1GV12_9LACO|nr:LysM peptidoglycan-binding domain-containing protein [Fructobacillus durionis]SFC15306.1 peptidoglycan hydrolase [Fructobacillus durionis]